MKELQFVAKLFKHDRQRVGCYIPQAVTAFYGLDSEGLVGGEKEIGLELKDGREFQAFTFQAYPFRNTIRVLIPDFWNAELKGKLARVTISTSETV